MEKKINVAELLKDCPKGMELDCMMSENVFFDCVTDNPIYPIRLYVQSEKDSITLTSFGCTTPSPYAKCVIFPKGKTTWDEFKRPFKDGDILATDLGSVFYLNTCFNTDECYGCYAGIGGDGSFHIHEPFAYKECCGFATEEEKEKLFDTIKSNGYKWNEKNKTLEKLVEPIFKVGNIIQDKNGYKVRITDVDIEKEYYVYESLTINGIGGISFNRQDEWELAPNKFDINTLKPFESKVLVRDYDNRMWIPTFWGKRLEDDYNCRYLTTNGCYRCCIPYEQNEHLLGTTNDCDEYFKNW